MRRAPRPVPGHGPLEPVAQRRRRLPAEELAGAASRRGRGAAGRSASSVSQMISPSKPVTSATISASSRIEVSSPVPRLTGSRAVVALGGEREPLDAVVDVEELPRRRAVAPEHDLVPALEHLPDQLRDHVRASRGRSCRAARRGWPAGGRRLEAVLVAVGLRAHEHGLLGDAVRRVRLLRDSRSRARPRWNGHRRELRIGADGAGDHELLDLVQPGLLEHVRAHHQVRVPVAAGVGAVRADPADLGGEVEDELRARVRRRGGQPRPSSSGRSRARRAANTSWPSASSRSTSREPRNPPPPVTSALTRPAPVLCARIRLGEHHVEALGRALHGRLTRRVSGSGLVPIRLGSIERSPGLDPEASRLRGEAGLDQQRLDLTARPVLEEVRRSESLRLQARREARRVERIRERDVEDEVAAGSQRARDLGDRASLTKLLPMCRKTALVIARSMLSSSSGSESAEAQIG